MIHILVVSHGQLAEGLIDSAKMIVGDQPDLSHLSLSRGEGAHEFAEALDAWLASNEGPVLICCDLRGGTPFNVAARAAHADGRIKVWYGINLAVLMEALLKRKGDLGSLITHLNKVVPASVGHAEF